MSYEGPGIYRHYKGGAYWVCDLALQEDTVVKPERSEHADAGPEVSFVIYRPLSSGSLLENRAESAWARRLDDFNADVVMDGRTVPRFKWIAPL